MMGMRAALKAAEKGEHSHYKMGAAVVRGGSVIAIGRNRGRIHAEESAIKKCDASGCDIYVARLRGRASKPCPKCARMLKAAGVRKVFYFDWSGDTVCQKVSLLG